ncbi:IMPACT family protein [Flavobacterium pallidum]|uniref:YigZ family protein n=1 Tax=Flavobacterium pallidum TaxID=2172098 RepID=A0A2S1SL33_9FLAO|nr:YigZ family protein [Flavobacterium pallidum]AWI27115.1 YigZ family protein [Flavobacterium pallidum]
MNPEVQDTYKTISTPSEEALFKEKGSKFFGYAFPVSSEIQVKEILEQLRTKHYSARHWCYAYQFGTEKVTFRTNDDGEPNNSAGMPIYGQIQSFKVTDVLIVVVRYFGGVKLGVGGLISAYRTAAQMALENSEIIEKIIRIHFIIHFEYKNMNKVMRMIRENQLEIVSQKMKTDCEIEISCRKKTSQTVFETFHSAFEIDIRIKE